MYPSQTGILYSTPHSKPKPQLSHIREHGYGPWSTSFQSGGLSSTDLQPSDPLLSFRGLWNAGSDSQTNAVLFQNSRHQQPRVCTSFKESNCAEATLEHRSPRLLLICFVAPALDELMGYTIHHPFEKHDGLPEILYNRNKMTSLSFGHKSHKYNLI